MRFSYSRVDTFKQCPRKFLYRYIRGLETYPNYDPANPLVIGTALHTGIEKDVETAIKDYFAYFPVIDDKHVDEEIKLEHVINKACEILPIGEHEREINVNADGVEFVGFVDLLSIVDNDTFDLYDFKYSNGIDRYLESAQLHVYKYYFEKMNPGKTIRKMYFVFAPKVQIRLKKTENLEDFRVRLRNELASKNVLIREVEYNNEKVEEFKQIIEKINHTVEYPKNVNKLCDWCEYKEYCESDEKDDCNIDWKKTFLSNMKKGVDNMKLPENHRRTVEKVNQKRIWLYGAPFSGKTYLSNAFPDPLMLNTDGNVRFIDAPCIAIKDVLTVEGRITKRTYAWEVFKDAISELEKGGNTFKTIVVDLLEDTYESCRQYMFNKLGIEHESDSSYGKAWDMIKTEFINTYKALMTLDYENIILISHEDTSKDLTKKSGDKITTIKPNIGEKPALKIAGMVDLVLRVVNDGGNRTLSFKNNEFVFGGGRLNITNIDIPCDYAELCKVYDGANSNTAVKGAKTPVEDVKPVEGVSAPVKEERPVERLETAVIEPMGETPETPAETPKRRVRRQITEE